MISYPGLPPSLAALVEQLTTFPGVGPKSALRMALHLLERPADHARQIASMLLSLHEQVGFCPNCGCFCERGGCCFCGNPKRDASRICVVEQPIDALLFERGGNYHGLYHALHGRMSPIDGVGPQDLRMAALDKRIEQGGVSELILALSATVDGEATAHYLARRYGQKVAKISRIARGIPEGGELEYLDEFTLSRALASRVTWEKV